MLFEYEPAAYIFGFDGFTEIHDMIPCWPCLYSVYRIQWKRMFIIINDCVYFKTINIKLLIKFIPFVGLIWQLFPGEIESNILIVLSNPQNIFPPSGLNAKQLAAIISSA